MRSPLILIRAAATAALLAVTTLPARADFDDLDARLREQAPKIIEYLQKNNCENVGVLKFLVDRGDGKASDNAGPLNAGIAGRLEVALLLSLRDEKPGVVYQANEVAAKIRGASHLTAEGRQKFFRRPYVLAWGEPGRTVQPDRFLTGLVSLSKDLRQTTVRVDAFDRDGKLDEGIVTFAIDTPPRVLAETGYSYLITPKSNPELFKGIRGSFKKSEIQKTVVDQTIQYTSSQGNGGGATPPSIEKDAPIKVAILINGAEVPVADGAIPEPKEGDRLVFRLENVSDSVQGVVLKVNGENTIFREKFDGKDCYKWILKPGEKVLVAGFQKTPMLRDDFRIQTPEESQAGEVNYGPFAGTFQAMAFRGKLLAPGEKPRPIKTESKEEEALASAAISRGSVQFSDDDNGQKPRPQSLAELQEQLKGREKSASDGRGMVGTGAEKESEIKKVTFEADPPEAVMNYTIRYYKPKGK